MENSSYNSWGPFIALIAIIFLVTTFLARGAVDAGRIADAEITIRPGQSYECVTSLANPNDEEWYTIVRTDSGEYFGLRFKEQPPLKGVAATKDGKTIFLPIESPGVKIKNPLGN